MWAVGASTRGTRHVRGGVPPSGCFPIYRWFHKRIGRGNAAALESTLAALWADLAGGSNGLEAQRDLADEFVPYEAHSWVDESFDRSPPTPWTG